MSTGKFLHEPEENSLLKDTAEVHYKRLRQGDSLKRLRIVHDKVLWHLEDYVSTSDLPPKDYPTFAEVWNTCGYDVLLIPIVIDGDEHLAIYTHTDTG